MALTYTERPDSQGGTLGKTPRSKLKWNVMGNPAPTAAGGDDADNGIVIAEYIGTFVPSIFGSNILTEVTYDWVAPGTWLAVADYGLIDWRPTGDAAWTFSTAGGTQHIEVSRQHIKTYAGPAVNATYNLGTDTYAPGPTTSNGSSGFDGLLNVEPVGQQGVKGLDVPTRQFSFQTTLYLSESAMTNSYMQLLYTLTDCVNSTSQTITVDGVSLTFNEGELRFDGATGARRGYGDWELTLNFSAVPNGTNLTVGSGPYAVTGIDKNGWDYLSITYMQGESDADPAGKQLVPYVQYVMVEQIFDYENFSGLVPSGTSGTPSEPFGGGGSIPTGG